jgi:hypothetical protein
LEDIHDANYKNLSRSSYLLKLFKGAGVRNLAKTLPKVRVQLSYNENHVSNSERGQRAVSMFEHRNPETEFESNFRDLLSRQPRINEGSPSRMGSELPESPEKKTGTA